MARKNTPNPDGTGASLVRLRASNAAGLHARGIKRLRTRSARRRAAINDASA